MMAKTIGIDLASQADSTAVCIIDWSEAPAQIVEPIGKDHWTDEALLDLLESEPEARVAIDAPFGWPVEFAVAVNAYTTHGTWPVANPDLIRHRATERRLTQTGSPLSASLDPLSWVAVRCARLLQGWATATKNGIDRTGNGRFVETYPAAALRAWSFQIEGSYKQPKEPADEVRQALTKQLTSELAEVVEMPAWLQEACEKRGGDHLIDALVCALIARAADLDRLEPIPSEAVSRATQEGWIRLPAARTLRESLT